MVAKAASAYIGRSQKTIQPSTTSALNLQVLAIASTISVLDLKKDGREAVFI